MGYSPWYHKGLNMTEQLTLFHFLIWLVIILIKKPHCIMKILVTDIDDMSRLFVVTRYTLTLVTPNHFLTTPVGSFNGNLWP